MCAWEHASRTALGAWVRDLAAKHHLQARVDHDVTRDVIRVTVFTTASGHLRANFVDMDVSMLDRDADVPIICANVDEGITSLLCKLTPRVNGGAFTQDDAIKMFGGGRERRVRRSRS